MRYQGKITDWRDDKGFGFITPNGGGGTVFVHVKAFANRQRRPAGDELVTYTLAADAQGRPRAIDVAYVGEKRRKAVEARKSSGRLPVLLATAFVAFVAAVTVLGRLPLIVPGVYLLTSIIAFFAYAFDKSAAQSGQWRTPESTLHAIALVGGWPGALAAQRLLRHKSSKASFQTVFWVTVVLNCGALGWLMTPAGSELLQSVLSGL